MNRYDWSSVHDAGYGLWVAAYYKGYTTIYGFEDNPTLYGTVDAWEEDLALYQYTSSGRISDGLGIWILTSSMEMNPHGMLWQDIPVEKPEVLEPTTSLER